MGSVLYSSVLSKGLKFTIKQGNIMDMNLLQFLLHKLSLTLSQKLHQHSRISECYTRKSNKKSLSEEECVIFCSFILPPGAFKELLPALLLLLFAFFVLLFLPLQLLSASTPSYYPEGKPSDTAFTSTLTNYYISFIVCTYFY